MCPLYSRAESLSQDVRSARVRSEGAVSSHHDLLEEVAGRIGESWRRPWCLVAVQDTAGLSAAVSWGETTHATADKDTHASTQPLLHHTMLR